MPFSVLLPLRVPFALLNHQVSFSALVWFSGSEVSHKRKRPYVRNMPNKRFMLKVPADDTEETFLCVSDYTKISVVRNMLEWIYLTKLIHRCSTDYFMKWHQNEMSDIDVSCQFCIFETHYLRSFETEAEQLCLAYENLCLSKVW